MKTPNYLAVRTTAKTRLTRKLADGVNLTAEEIRDMVNKCAEFLEVDDVDLELVIADLESDIQTSIGTERTLLGENDGWRPWLTERITETSFDFWNRYQQHLREGGWPESTLHRLDVSTNSVLGLLGDPQRLEPWDRRGLVVGHVQSGKTANYIGLICKAADAGYKLIVVLAGFHRNLRSQTQVRLEEGFLGFDRSTVETGLVRVGVGNVDPKPKANSITTRLDDGDFKRSVAKNFGISPGGHPLLFVVKKEGRVLRNLLNWVEFASNNKDEKGHKYVSGVPLLVIDDEADQGSVDTRGGSVDDLGEVDRDHDPTPINSRIRQLLRCFDQSAYVGYTATPFANVLIHDEATTELVGEDLFPRNFIVALPAPSNHVGPRRVFGGTSENGDLEEGLPLTRHVIDHADSLELNERSGWVPPRHNRDHIPRFEGQNRVPPSLFEAICAFILACAARRARGDGDEHCSMLVHVTRFTWVQARIKDQIDTALLDIQRRLRYGDGDSSGQILDDLRELWESDFPLCQSELRQIPSRN